MTHSPVPRRRFRFAALWLVIPLLLAACTSRTLPGVQTFTFKAGDHREGRLVYDQTPPAGGAHSPIWQNCGVYTQPLYSEYAVHSLEHGAVWITYQSDLTAPQLNLLTQQAEGRTHVLISPHGQQSSPVMLTAWGTQLALDDPADARVKQFIDRYEQGSGTPERGAACSGGYSGTS